MGNILKELQTQKTLQIIEEYLEKEKKLCDNMRDPIFIWNLLGLADSGTRRKYLGWLNLCLLLGADPGDKCFVVDDLNITYFNPLYE